MPLALTLDVWGSLQEVPLQDARPQLEAPEPGRSEESHRILRRAQRERLAGGDHRSLQRVAIKCSLGLARREGPRRVTERGKRESGVAEHGQDVLPEGQGQKWGSSVGKCSLGRESCTCLLPLSGG